MAITTSFEDGALSVYDDGRKIVYQPFKPMHDGSLGTWTEEEALAWWDTEKSMLIDRSKYEIDANNNIILIGSK